LNSVDQVLLALTAWRENRGGGLKGMQSVINVICNRAKKRNTSPYEECVRPWQFSSITAKGDPELTLWPAPSDEQFSTAQTLATLAGRNELVDITGGATFYYALSMKTPPSWAASMTKTVEIQNQAFFK
jgi:N-acetylmuramoyl-L-alanine amidase